MSRPISEFRSSLYDSGMVEVGAFILVTLAVARLTRLVTSDRIMLSLRRWVVNKYGEDSEIAYLAHCKACASVWISALGALVWTGALLPIKYWWLGVAAWLAISHLTILLARLEDDVN